MRRIAREADATHWRCSEATSTTQENHMDVDTTHAFETKAGMPAEAGTTYDQMMRAFEAFREANDARLAALERKQADALNEEKVARINAAIDTHQRRIDELTLKAARPALEMAFGRCARAACAQGGVRILRPSRRKRRAARARSQGDVGRLQSRRRLPRARRARARDRPQARR
jgi:predicted phage gp36 major capsid-like protein